MKEKIVIFLKHPVTLAVIRIFLGAVFLLSSITKVGDPGKFQDAIVAYHIVPELFIPTMAVIIPWLQLICGILLIVDCYVKSAALILGGLLGVYTTAIFLAWIRGIEIPCGCFDLMIGLEDEVGLSAIIRDLSFLALAADLFFFDSNKPSFYGLTGKLSK